MDYMKWGFVPLNAKAAFHSFPANGCFSPHMKHLSKLFPVHTAPSKRMIDRKRVTQKEKEDWDMEILNVPFWSSRAVVSELNIQQWHMRDIRAARQRSPVQRQNEDTSFSISAPLSTDRHTQTQTYTKIYREKAESTWTVWFTLRAGRMLQFILLHGTKKKEQLGNNMPFDILIRVGESKVCLMTCSKDFSWYKNNVV